MTSARRATISSFRSGTTLGYFYPRPPRGGRPSSPSGGTASTDFYPRPPRGGRLGRPSSCAMMKIFLSTPSARRATAAVAPAACVVPISIHALREEGDSAARARAAASSYFYPRPPRGGRRDEAVRWLAKMQISIHALREEGDEQDHLRRESVDAFLSTPSARRATWLLLRCSGLRPYFYPRPPRGGRPTVQA